MPKVTIDLPPLFRASPGSGGAVSVDGSTVEEALRDLIDTSPELGPKLFTPGGKLRGSVTVFVNEVDVRYREREQTQLRPGDALRIVSALPGG